MKKFTGTTAGRAAILIVVMMMCLLSAQAATATSSQRSALSERPVAHTKKGDLTSRIVGSTGDGRQVTGSFVPLRFIKRDGKLLVRGLVQGVVHERDGSTTTFAKLKTARVKSINGTPARAGSRTTDRAACDILHLVLAPLNLDLLGLQVHLDRVVLDIVAQSGAGNLLGNLLCAVTGLLDGGVGGLLGRLTNLLNQILGVLRLG
ncbi:hypothetical protein [Nocardioides sp.]|uniref:hypothetical protein n=1 Tax=Nocardioides sp. TaxID=35761 RepID=UPI0026336EB1|nr:hypothetical protein [Nocardioides sp.]MDI6912084.1 hypothetical protein [Nocardioides sp.]